MNKTNIEWTDFTWNPITGCTAISDGCKNCYAKAVHERFYDTPFTQIQFHENRLSEPSNRKKAAKIFIGSMTDIFQDDVTFDYLLEVMKVIMSNPQHTFQILTKRPNRMKDFFNWFYEAKAGNLVTKYPFIRNIINPLPNLWLGVTVENQSEADKRIPILLDISATKRFLSVEPLISRIELNTLIDIKRNIVISSLNGKVYPLDENKLTNKIDWVIVGGETGIKDKTRAMSYDWVQRIYKDCKNSKTPFFFKQWGNYKTNNKFDFENIKEFPL